MNEKTYKPGKVTNEEIKPYRELEVELLALIWCSLTSYLFQISFTDEVTSATGRGPYQIEMDSKVIKEYATNPKIEKTFTQYLISFANRFRCSLQHFKTRLIWTSRISN